MISSACFILGLIEINLIVGLITPRTDNSFCVMFGVLLIVNSITLWGLYKVKQWSRIPAITMLAFGVLVMVLYVVKNLSGANFGTALIYLAALPFALFIAYIAYWLAKHNEAFAK